LEGILQNLYTPFFTRLAKSHVSFCHHFAGPWLSPLIFFMFDSLTLYSRWPLLLKIKISLMACTCNWFILSQNEMKFKMELHGNE
jgi:hypothetical protein